MNDHIEMKIHMPISIRSMFKGAASGMAMVNMLNCQQEEREHRLRSNINKLEEMQRETPSKDAL